MKEDWDIEFIKSVFIMAEPITKKQLKKIPVTRYDEIRAELMTGHIFFSSGSYTFQESSGNLPIAYGVM